MQHKKVMAHEIMPTIQEMLASDQTVFLKVSGNSMRPFYVHHQTVVSLLKPNRAFKRFDVCLYQDCGVYKLHRIVKIKDDTLIILGDALNQKELIQKTQIIGLVHTHQNKGKVIKHHQKRYLFKVYVWHVLRPFRRILLKLLRKTYGSTH